MREIEEKVLEDLKPWMEAAVVRHVENALARPKDKLLDTVRSMTIAAVNDCQPGLYFLRRVVEGVVNQPTLLNQYIQEALLRHSHDDRGKARLFVPGDAPQSGMQTPATPRSEDVPNPWSDGPCHSLTLEQMKAEGIAFGSYGMVACDRDRFIRFTAALIRAAVVRERSL